MESNKQTRKTGREDQQFGPLPARETRPGPEAQARTAGERERGPVRAAAAKRRGVTQLLGPCQVMLPPFGPRDLLPKAPLERSRVAL